MKGDIMNWAVLLVIGILIGMIAYKLIFSEKPIGTLKVDDTDLDGGPYLFLEIDRGRLGDIYRNRHVCVRVDIPRK